MDVSRINYPPPPIIKSGDVAPPVEVEPQVPVVVSFPSVEEAEQTRVAERNEAKLDRAVAELNKSLTTYARHMSVSMHESTGRTMVTIYNTDTREVIREIPPQKVLDTHASLMEIAGLFVDTRG